MVPARPTSLQRACLCASGFDSTVHRLSEQTTEEELLNLIARLNADKSVDGFIVQMPLPRSIDEQKVIAAVDPPRMLTVFIRKWADSLGLPTFVSATPYGIMALLEHYKIETRGKHCVVLGRSNIVGRPIANCFRKKRTGRLHGHHVPQSYKNLASTHTGQISLLRHLSPRVPERRYGKRGSGGGGCGHYRIPADNEKGYRIVGDVAFDEVAPKCSYITRCRAALVL